MIQSHLDVYSYIVRELPSFENMPDQAPIILNPSADSAAMSAQEMANSLHTSDKRLRHLPLNMLSKECKALPATE
ncbi:hypothetical protein [Salinicola socius]|uniref:Uncharacterized protein n=1 Tax=Salinicola socius TaxID=404433 RepID=A0A1Q8SSR7_9GAMM|nr:hypothetical protein [Salinicola socius]OLO04478.1 hypothetical protein BTW07_08585 [Salinicola socius]